MISSEELAYCIMTVKEGNSKKYGNGLLELALLC